MMAISLIILFCLVYAVLVLYELEQHLKRRK
jgi:hypothetical protein